MSTAPAVRYLTAAIANGGMDWSAWPSSCAGTTRTPMMLRRHFTRRWGITPQAYRHRFSQLAG
jgi:methylphosphotriester-DNA--protein-cysteine methyltransferase